MNPILAHCFNPRSGRWFAISLLFPMVLLCNSEFAISSPYTPDSITDVIVTVPDALLAIKREEDDQQAANNKANNYFNLARDHSDPRWYGFAKTALLPWWDSGNRSLQTRFAKVEIYQFHHEFDNALLELNQIIKLQPRLPKAFLSRATVHTMLGNFSLALQDCQHLLLTGSPVLGAHCTAQVKGVTGSGQEAIHTLTSILDIAQELSNAEKFEIHVSLATIAHRHNNLKLASEHYQRALAIQPRNAYLLAHFSDLLMETGQLENLGYMTENDTPVLEQKIKRLFFFQKTNPEAARELTAKLNLIFENPVMNQDEFPYKEYADFLLITNSKTDKALTASLENWAIQKDPSSALLVLKCALAARDSAAAYPVIEWVKTTELYDHRIESLMSRLNRMYTTL